MAKRWGMKLEFQKCRTGYRHSWEDYVPLEDPWKRGKKKLMGARFSMLCTRCGTMKHSIIDARGELACAPKYDWPEGYKVAADELPSIEQRRLFLIAERKAHTQTYARRVTPRGKAGRKATPTKSRKLRAVG